MVSQNIKEYDELVKENKELKELIKGLKDNIEVEMTCSACKETSDAQSWIWRVFGDQDCVQGGINASCPYCWEVAEFWHEDE